MYSHMNDCPFKSNVRFRAASYLKDYDLSVNANLRNGQVKGYYSGVKPNSIFYEKTETEYMLPIPKLFADLCKFILENNNREKEDIFREGGSKSEQDKIKRKIHKKEHWQSKTVNPIDVAALIKFYIKELPVALIPSLYHELFLTCCDTTAKEDTILVSTLLLPIENINLLSYLMTFFYEVAIFSKFNKMTSHNLAVCIAPNILPIRVTSLKVINKQTEVVKILIEQADRIGIIPHQMQRHISVIEQYSQRISVDYAWNRFRRKLLSLFRRS